MQVEIERQGLKNYIAGNYILGKLDHNGQRISIRVTIPRKSNGNDISFVTGCRLDIISKRTNQINYTPLKVNKMKMLDCVEIIAEKEKYIKNGVHKGMQGWICLDDCTNGYWLVNFPQCGEKDDIAEISINEKDMRIIPSLNATVNEQIKEMFNE